MKKLERELMKSIQKEAGKAISKEAGRMARQEARARAKGASSRFKEFSRASTPSGLLGFRSNPRIRGENHSFVHIPRYEEERDSRGFPRIPRLPFIEERMTDKEAEKEVTEKENWNVPDNTTMILVKDGKIICSVEKVESGYKCMEEVFTLEKNAILLAHDYIRKLGKGKGYQMIYFTDSEIKEF